jgi:glycosyltransferase involved in cell wall biosynthesis
MLKIVIDLQGAQSESRFRGIGRYSLNLALAIARNPRQHEIFLALNAAFPDSVSDLRETFRNLLPQDHIRIFEIPSPTAECNADNYWRARAAEKIREQFLREMNPDAVLITSHFDGYGDNAVTSIGVFVPELPVAAVAYDLIPYLHQTEYLSDAPYRKYYLRKMQGFIQAKLLLATSEKTRQEIITVLGYPENNIICVSAPTGSCSETKEGDEGNDDAWDNSAKQILTAIASRFSKSIEQVSPAFQPHKKPSLAFVSPLPPERSSMMIVIFGLNWAKEDAKRSGRIIIRMYAQYCTGR